MAAETRPDSRFQLLDRPIMSPGNCGVCGYSGEDRKYFDARLDFEFYGTFYICEVCVFEMASVIGWVTPEIADRQELELTELRTEVVKLRSAVMKLEEGLDALRTVRNHSFVSDAPDLSVVRDVEPTPETPTTDNGPTEQVTEQDTGELRGSDTVKSDGTDQLFKELGLDI